MNNTEKKECENKENLPVPAHIPADIPPVEVIEAVVKPQVTTEEAVKLWQEYQELKRNIATPDDIQKIEGADFYKKSYWRKLSTFFNLNVVIISEVCQELLGDVIYNFVCRATAPNGRNVVGSGSCSIFEEAIYREGKWVQFKKEWSDKYNKKVKMKDKNGDYIYEPAIPKSFHDARATAETRAFNRAVSNLVGGGEVSAEEVKRGHGNDQESSQENSSDKAKSDIEKAQSDLNNKKESQSMKSDNKPDLLPPANNAKTGNTSQSKLSKEDIKFKFDNLIPKLNESGKIMRVCENDGVNVDDPVYRYSFNNFGHVLCRKCQDLFKDYRKK